MRGKNRSLVVSEVYVLLCSCGHTLKTYFYTYANHQRWRKNMKNLGGGGGGGKSEPSSQ